MSDKPLSVTEKMSLPDVPIMGNIEEAARHEAQYYMQCRRANAGHFEYWAKRRFLLLMRIRRALRATGVK